MKTKRAGSTLAAVLLVVTAVLIAYVIKVCSQYPERPKSTKKPAPENQQPSFRLNEIVKLRGTHGGEVWFFASPEMGAVGEGLSITFDQHRLQEMVNAEALWAEPAGGTAKIVAFKKDTTFIREKLGNHATWIQIRRLDGPHKGTRGWVNARSLTR